MNGPRLFTEHLLTEDDEQWAKLTLEDLVEHMPDNFKKVSLTHASVAELYVVPLYRAPLHITGYILTATHAIAFPGSSSSEELRQAKIDMGIYVMEEGVPRYTVQGARLYHLNGTMGWWRAHAKITWSAKSVGMLIMSATCVWSGDAMSLLQ